MSIVQTKEYRRMKDLREELALYWNSPPTRHLIYLIDEYLSKRLGLERLKLERNILDDKIFCAEELIRLVEGLKGGLDE